MLDFKTLHNAIKGEGTILQITLHGARGSVPTPANNKLKYGGNTTCIVVNAGGHTIIIDGGTGILNSKTDFTHADILISHLHNDHISGFPLYKPFFDINKSFDIYGEIREKLSIKQQLVNVFKAPYFPINIGEFMAKIEYKDILHNQKIMLHDDVCVETIHTNHPNTCTAFKIIHDNKSFVNLVDHEHLVDPDIDAFVNNCDLLIYDSHFSKGDYIAGWGHSTWQEGVRLARRCNVKKLILFHHNPDYTDEVLDKLQAEVASVCGYAKFALEGETINL